MSIATDLAEAKVAQSFVARMLVEYWRDIFNGTRHIQPFGNVVRFPNTTYAGMDIQFSKNYINVNYEDAPYRISFDIDKKTGKPKDILFSSNWTVRLLNELHATFMQHLVNLTRIGAA